MRAIFTTDKVYDAKAMWWILHIDDPAGIENRAKSMRISKRELDYIRSKKQFGIKDKFFNDLINNRYKKETDTIKKAVISYQSAWNEINDYFFREIEKITGTKWKYQKYFVILSPFNVGISSQRRNKIIRSCFEDPYKQRRITAHELLMTHIWNIFDKKFKNTKTTENSLWALNEIATVSILSLESSLNKIWGNNYEKYLKNYPQLNALKMELKQVYLTKINFFEYLKRGIEIIKGKNKIIV